MPTYQYHCDDCGHEFEEFQSMTDDAIDVCPECKAHTRRLITGGAGLIFKGSGFYCTDYRSAKYKSDQSKDSSSSASSSAKSDSSKSSDKKTGKDSKGS